MKGRRADAQTHNHPKSSSASARVPASPRPRAPASPRPRVPAPLRPHVRASHPPSVPAITLLTDFGTVDYFVASMRGVILSVNPGAQIIDLTHEVPPYDIEAGAFTLLAAYQSFPAGTIHVAVVDPGVGSSRRPILVAAGKQFFIGPDNGIFSFVMEREAGFRIFHLTNGDYFRPSVSATFHGRDVFAPVAAALSAGVSADRLGTEVFDCVRLTPLTPQRVKGRLKARIIHIDRFGNCVTSLTPRELTGEMIAGGARLIVKGREITSFKRFFAQQEPQKHELFAFWGSAGFLEIAALNRAAAKILKAKRGQSVILTTKSL